jgi:hypothetical protein
MTPRRDADEARNPHDARAVVRDVSHAIDRTTARAQKVAKGTYSPGDAAADFAWWAAQTWEWGYAYVTCMQNLFGGREQVPRMGLVGHPIEAKLRPPATGPISLAARPFRAIGWPREFDVSADAVVFTPSPPNLPAGADTFTVTVAAPTVPAEARNHTIIYEGVIVDAATGYAVTDVIRVAKPAHVP